MNFYLGISASQITLVKTFLLAPYIHIVLEAWWEVFFKFHNYLSRINENILVNSYEERYIRHYGKLSRQTHFIWAVYFTM